MNNKIKFIEYVLNEKIVLKGKDEEQLIQECKKLKLEMHKDSYDYLLTIQIRSMTAKHVEDLKKKYEENQKSIKTLKATSIKEIWSAEIDQCIASYDKWNKDNTA